MSDDAPLPDLPSVLRVTEHEIERRKQVGFTFWSCVGCDCNVFHLDSDQRIWFVTCTGCQDEYQILEGGTIELVRTPRNEGNY